MTYLEIVVSDGPGTLVRHYCRPRRDEYFLSEVVDLELPFILSLCSVQTLTEQEAQAFYTMHGDSWVAV